MDFYFFIPTRSVLYISYVLLGYLSLICQHVDISYLFYYGAVTLYLPG